MQDFSEPLVMQIYIRTLQRRSLACCLWSPPSGGVLIDLLADLNETVNGDISLQASALSSRKMSTFRNVQSGEEINVPLNGGLQQHVLTTEFTKRFAWIGILHNTLWDVGQSCFFSSSRIIYMSFH